MTKVKKGVWQVLGESVKLYFLNFDKFFIYLSFPVLGQILGLLWVMFISEFYLLNLTKMVHLNSFFNNFSIIFIILLLIILPGFFIFVKALIDYLVAYGAINSMTENALKSGRVYDFTAHTELVNRRSISFFTLWLLFGIFSILAFLPFFWIVGGILFVYFILIFQVFTFESDKSPIGCFKKSFNIIKGNFAKTVLVMAVIGGITYFVVPELVKYLMNLGHITDFISIPFIGCVKQLPLNSINQLLAHVPNAVQFTPQSVAKFFTSTIISYILICYTLPLRSICWTLWYLALNKPEKSLDNEILKRATRKKKDEPSYKIDD